MDTWRSHRINPNHKTLYLKPDNNSDSISIPKYLIDKINPTVYPKEGDRIKVKTEESIKVIQVSLTN